MGSYIFCRIVVKIVSLDISIFHTETKQIQRCKQYYVLFKYNNHNLKSLIFKQKNSYNNIL